jgi:hypothetical protein
MDILLWNIILTAFLGLVSWFAIRLHTEADRQNVLLNKTREEMVRCQLDISKEYARREEVKQDFDRVMERLDALDAKIDRLIEAR